MKTADTGIFLNRIPYSESSVIVSYFTKNLGYKRFIYLGGRKKNPQLFPLNIQQLTYYNRQDSELLKLSSAESDGRVKEIPFHQLRSALAFFVAEVLQKCLNHTEQDLALYAFLEKQIEQLDQLEDLSYFPHLFLLDLSGYLGFQPSIESKFPNSFHLQDGRFTDEHLKEESITGNEMLFLFHLLCQQKYSVTRTERAKALDALVRYYELHLESFGPLKSKAILQELFE